MATNIPTTRLVTDPNVPVGQTFFMPKAQPAQRPDQIPLNDFLTLWIEGGRNEVVFTDPRTGQMIGKLVRADGDAPKDKLTRKQRKMRAEARRNQTLLQRRRSSRAFSR
jgi:hypothetical protein